MKRSRDTDLDGPRKRYDTVELAHSVKSLNRSFYDKFRSLVQGTGNNASLAAQDYLGHIMQLEDRFLKQNGDVLTFGSGDCGQLAHGAEDDDDLMVRYPRIVISLRDKRVLGIACGGLHNAVWTDTGHVYTWGCADDGSLGRTGDENAALLVDTFVELNICVVNVACGDGQTIAVTSQGKVYGWGCYKDKEGKKWFSASPGASKPVDDIKKQQNTPMLIEGISNALDVVCGSSFNLVRCSTGGVYSWGLGECGELGRTVGPMRRGVGEEAKYDMVGILRDHLTPGHMYRAVSTKHDSAPEQLPIKDIRAIGCGAYHSMVITTGGQVLATGLNNYAQLGLGQDDTEARNYLTHVKALDGENVVCVRGGVHHSLVMTSSGGILSFGRGDSCQLGIAGLNEQAAGTFSGIPLRPELPKGVKAAAISCGGNHNLVITSDNEVYSWGYGDMLALGNGAERDEPVPAKVKYGKAAKFSINVSQIAGGGQHSALIGKIH